MTRIYKLLDRSNWEAALAGGRFDGSPVDLADGYIHFSAADQAGETARRYFRGQAGLMLLTLETDDFPPETAAALRWELSRGGALFPHLYAPLDPALVREARAVALDAEGAPLLGELKA